MRCKVRSFYGICYMMLIISQFQHLAALKLSNATANASNFGPRGNIGPFFQKCLLS